jgi:fibronectin type 3 domain-containing protein
VTNLHSSDVTTSSVTLGWDAATDDQAVDHYVVQTSPDGVGNWSAVDQSTGTSYVDTTAVTQHQTLHLRVQAVDTSGNGGPFSTPLTVSTPDTAAPATPTGLSVASTTPDSASLQWTAALDDDGSAVAGYVIYEQQGGDWTQVDQVMGTSDTISGLDADAVYSFRVTSIDAALNQSNPTSPVQANTGTAADATPPSVPAGLTATALDQSSISLSWDASSDDTGVARYLVLRWDGAAWQQVGTSSDLTFTDTGLAPSSTYYYSVEAQDAALNTSDGSAWATADTLTQDTTAPSAPQDAHATTVSDTAASLEWTPSTDDTGVDHYVVERWDGAQWSQVGTPADAGFQDTGLAASTSYQYRVSALDAAGNDSGPGAPVTVTTSAASSDTTPPDTPTGLAADTVADNAISFHWNVAADNGGGTVIGYVVYWRASSNDSWRGLKFTTDPTYTDQDSITPRQHDEYAVTAVDDAGNESPTSTPLVVDTPASTDTTPPTQPQALRSTTHTATSISVAWDPSTDPDQGDAITYFVFRWNGTDWHMLTQAGISGTTYTDSGLPNFAGEYYTVVACDAATNCSDAADYIYAPDATDPTTPQLLTVTAHTGTSVSLSWQASFDASGVWRYLVLRRDSALGAWHLVGTPAGRSFTDTGLTSVHPYWYVVASEDSYENVSYDSNTVTATTSDNVPPTTPALRISRRTRSSLSLAWTRSTDNVGVVGYRVYRMLGSTPKPLGTMLTSTSATVARLARHTTYRFRVTAFDAAGNSRSSAIVSGKTL